MGLGGRRLSPYPAAMGGDQLFHDGQADAGPTVFPGAGLLSPVEALKDKGEILGGDAFTGIRQGQLDFSGRALGEALDVATRRGVLAGILE